MTLSAAPADAPRARVPHFRREGCKTSCDDEAAEEQGQLRVQEDELPAACGDGPGSVRGSFEDFETLRHQHRAQRPEHQRAAEEGEASIGQGGD